jgi:hypothetical protein
VEWLEAREEDLEAARLREEALRPARGPPIAGDPSTGPVLRQSFFDAAVEVPLFDPGLGGCGGIAIGSTRLGAKCPLGSLVDDGCSTSARA